MKNNLTVCYVDDDIVAREIFEEVLSKLDKTISIHLQETGEEFINFLQSSGTNVDLVFLDLNMPEKNGFDVLRDIKEMNNPHLPPVIVFSTSADDLHGHLSKKLGAKMYIEKPRHYETYVQTLQSLISAKWS